MAMEENGVRKSNMEDYEILEQIGSGSTFLVLHKTHNTKHVLKKFGLSKQATDKFKKTALDEMNLITKLQHPYIVQYKDAWVDETNSSICLVTNYCQGGDMSRMMMRSRGSYFSEEKICKWLTQLLLAINYLHSNRVLHRDLKLSNILVTTENDIRLGDFGLAKLLDEGGLTSSVVGTPNYMCPELLADVPYGYKSDIWSLGCCVFEIAAHQQAFRASDMSGLINKINRSLISPLPIIYSSTLKQIIKSMLRKSPEHRPTAAELLRHTHLQPYLLRCHNPSTVFLPVKSPSPKNAKEKMKKHSPPASTLSNKKLGKEREAKQKQRYLLPLFDENTDIQYPNLLEDEVLIEDRLETKRVDPTSFSGKISHDSEDSKSGGETTVAFHRDEQENIDLSTHKENVNVVETAGNLESTVVKDTEKTQNNPEDCSAEKCGPSTLPVMVEAAPSTTTMSADAVHAAELPNTCMEEENNGQSSTSSQNEVQQDNAETQLVSSSVETKAEKEDVSSVQLMNHNLIGDLLAQESKNSESDIPVPQRADALESLLELCARLLKQDKFDELSGVLKPFGEDVVSSRETAIWLTKSLINAQTKLSKES